MRTRALLPIVWLLAAAAGCSSAAASNGSPSGSGGSSGAGGMVISLDAAAWGSGGSMASGDAGTSSQLSPTLSGDAPTFNWDTKTCIGCDTGGSGGGEGGTAGTAGTGGPGSGGSSAASGSGGTTSRGWGGSSGRGGAVGLGGSSGSTGGGGTTSRPDAGLAQDAMGPPADAAPSIDASAAADTAGGGPDTVAPGADLPPADTASRADTATTSGCEARLRALVPSTRDLSQFPLVAGTNTRVVLRAEVVSGGPASPVWTWQAYRDGTPVSAITSGSLDPAAVQFPVASAGTYTFTALDQTTCVASVKVTAVAANACPACDRSVILRAAPLPGTDTPVQSGAIGLGGDPPFSGTNVVLATGTWVTISPNAGGGLVPAYVRISSQSGDLVADGLSDPKAGFRALLLAMDNNRALQSYDVLVVPIDGANGGTVAATAPQLFQDKTPAQINAESFTLSGGVTVWGDSLSVNGQYVQDARIILTNRDPKAPVQPNDLIFSSVGRTDAQGNCMLHAQAGQQYWVSISPPTGQGLAEALAPAPITLAGNATVTFQWNPITLAKLTLNVVGVTDGARVRLTSSAATTVGTLTVADNASGAVTTQAAQGNVRVEGTTVSGMVTFDNLPAGTSYDALIMPPALGPTAATTLLTVTVPAGGSTQTVQVARQGRIVGNLVWGNPGVPTDWSKVYLVAYDRSADTPESPQATSVNPDGSFVIGASPGRAYVVLAVPDTTSGLARTFVGPGPLEATEFSITQKVQASMDWTARVMNESQGGLSGTALQIFCGATWPGCIDPAIPLAETTSENGGAFDLRLADPATR